MLDGQSLARLAAAALLLSPPQGQAVWFRKSSVLPPLPPPLPHQPSAVSSETGCVGSSTYQWFADSVLITAAKDSPLGCVFTPHTDEKAITGSDTVPGALGVRELQAAFPDVWRVTPPTTPCRRFFSLEQAQARTCDCDSPLTIPAFHSSLTSPIFFAGGLRRRRLALLWRPA